MHQSLSLERCPARNPHSGAGHSCPDEFQHYCVLGQSLAAQASGRPRAGPRSWRDRIQRAVRAMRASASSDSYQRRPRRRTCRTGSGACAEQDPAETTCENEHGHQTARRKAGWCSFLRSPIESFGSTWSSGSAGACLTRAIAKVVFTALMFGVVSRTVRYEVVRIREAVEYATEEEVLVSRQRMTVTRDSVCGSSDWRWGSLAEQCK